MHSALKALIGWLILIFIGINLIGFFVRGLAMRSRLKKQISGADEFIAREYRTRLRFESIINFFTGAVCVIYPYVLFRWLGWQVAAAGALLMLARLPDLLYEIKTGTKIRLGNMPNRAIHVISAIVIVGVFLLVWWGISQGEV